MSIVKSFSVGDGDMFYISHNTDSFTIIDCCINDANKQPILDEIVRVSSKKGISRFISTHPDKDHFEGLIDLDKKHHIYNFYCVENQVIKEPETEDFKKYKSLRDSKKAFYLTKDCSRAWLNESKEGRGSSGISILWPDTNNQDFKEALKAAEDGASPNNISPIIRYSVQNGPSYLWMGDLKTDFMEKIENGVYLEPTDILFAPHHGRKTGKIPATWLSQLKPKIIVIGEADSTDLCYYQNYKTIKQNSAGHIEFNNHDNQIDVFVENSSYSEDFLQQFGNHADSRLYYIGTIQSR